ncbi:MAG TPA: hypothetical protein P5150_09965 [Candidatus Ratteibacteria bacterium]|nr:hypothetical protein [Candidatus Ratteibacteria bacterium]
MRTEEKYVIDKKGRKVGVLLNVKEYKKILKNIEELEEIKIYDMAKSSGDKVIPFDKAIEKIEKKKHK